MPPEAAIELILENEDFKYVVLCWDGITYSKVRGALLVSPRGDFLTIARTEYAASNDVDRAFLENTEAIEQVINTVYERIKTWQLQT